MLAPPKKELSGWKAIAKYLDVSIRAAQQREKDRGLPVHHEPGPKGRVFADLDELDAWRNQVGGNALPPRNDDSGAQTAKPLLARKFWPRALWAVTLPAMALLAIGAYIVTPHGPPSDFRVNGKNLIVENAKGQELWRHTFGGSLRDDAYSGDARLYRGWLGEITSRGRSELLFAALPPNEAEVGCQVVCFDADGRTMWSFKPGRPVTDASGDHMLPPYEFDSLQVLVGRKPADTRIAVASHHWLSQPAQVALLDVRGQVVGEYWHPGHLNYSAKADLDRNGQIDLLLAGVNNGNHQPTLVVLDPLRVRGLMTPKEMQQHGFEILGMPAAQEKAVVFFPRSCISRGELYTRVQSLRVTTERIVITTAEGVDMQGPGFVYELDYGLRVQQVTPDTAEVRRAHQALEARGEVDHPFSEECARLKAGVIVRNAGLKADR